ncbi:uncharacterized protein LOC131328263 [Rhododendron vialii]|uniref:uncharacterized protein LOC131328263 n=1 Tax=Rhododendron vialii TaxID=182163 RepID=UPI00265DC82C|nr:uncharacterized protein LOC131328263 [Rhododendron vialii]
MTRPCWSAAGRCLEISEPPWRSTDTVQHLSGLRIAFEDFYLVNYHSGYVCILANRLLRHSICQSVQDSTVEQLIQVGPPGTESGPMLLGIRVKTRVALELLLLNKCT